MSAKKGLKEKTYKVVYNNCFGGFHLSDKAINRYKELTGEEISDCCSINHKPVERHDKYLIQVIEELGKDASGSNSNLCIEEIKDNKYFITDYDGSENVFTSEYIIEIEED